MSDTPRADRPGGPDEAESTIRRPRLFASGRGEEPAAGDEEPAAGDEKPALEGEESAPDEGEHFDAAPHEPGDVGETAPALQLTEAGVDDPDARRRKRRITLIAVSAGVAIIMIALCLGGIGIVSAIHKARGNAADAQAARDLREADCLDLETRLNRLVPPGATTTPTARAAAVQDENSAVRIYLGGLREQSAADGWRRLLDARTTYAQSLQQESKTRTTAFFVAPRADDGGALTDQLVRMSPAPCAGSVRRLARPDL